MGEGNTLFSRAARKCITKRPTPFHEYAPAKGPRKNNGACNAQMPQAQKNFFSRTFWEYMGFKTAFPVSVILRAPELCVPDDTIDACIDAIYIYYHYYLLLTMYSVIRRM